MGYRLSRCSCQYTETGLDKEPTINVVTNKNCKRHAEIIQWLYDGAPGETVPADFQYLGVISVELLRQLECKHERGLLDPPDKTRLELIFGEDI